MTFKRFEYVDLSFKTTDESCSENRIERVRIDFISDHD